MSKLAVIGILLFIIIVFVIYNTRKGKHGTVILGQEMAMASKKEQQRIETGNYSTDSLSDFRYSKWSDEQSLLDPIENELDRKIAELCKKFMNADEEKRASITRSISQGSIYALLAFAQRVTLFGVRKKDSSYIHDGIIAVAMIDAERCDDRDALVALSFLNYGSQKLKLNSQAIFREAVGISQGKTKNLIRQFAERPAEQKSIEVVGGYTAVETAKGVGFIQTNYEEYKPEKNLVNILFGISDVVFKDKYKRGEITVGERIEPIWLSDKDDKRIETSLLKVTGCASLNTSPRKEFRPTEEMQMLLIYLGEFKDSLALQMLIEEVNGSMPKNFARLSFAEENILCVVIQRATIDGVEDLETNTSLRRFESLIRERIRQN